MRTHLPLSALSTQSRAQHDGGTDQDVRDGDSGSGGMLVAFTPSDDLACELKELLKHAPDQLVAGLAGLAATTAQALVSRVERAEAALLAGDLGALVEEDGSRVGQIGAVAVPANKMPDPWQVVREMQRRHVLLHVEVKA